MAKSTKKEKKKKPFVKSYKLLHKTNFSKSTLLFDLYAVYKKEYIVYTRKYWFDFINSNYDFTNPNFNYLNKFNFSHLGSTKHIITELNASYLQICLSSSCGALNKHLASIEQKFNLLLNKSSLNIEAEINPAYSSQECKSCGYVDEKNRKE